MGIFSKNPRISFPVNMSPKVGLNDVFKKGKIDYQLTLQLNELFLKKDQDKS